MNRIILIAVIVLAQACANIQMKSEADKGLSHSGVDFDYPETESDYVEIVPELIQNEETVRLGDRGGDVYTPGDINLSQAEQIRRLNIGLSLGPGLYRTITYVSLLKTLERNNFSPKLITGTEFGGIVAAMYASGMTPEVIEWNFYRYFKEKGNHAPYSKAWLEDIDNLLLSKLKGQKIEDTKRKFYITLYSNNTKKTYYFDRGNIRDLLLINLRLSNTNFAKKDNMQYSSASEGEVFNAALLKKLGAEFVIGADALGSKFQFVEKNEFLTKTYNQMKKRISTDKKGFDYFFNMSMSDMGLDVNSDFASYLMKSQESLESKVPSLKHKMNEKISRERQIEERENY